LIGHARYNSAVASPYSELLVRNTGNGHFYEWWIANNQLQGVDLGPAAAMGVGATPAVAGSDPSSVAAAGATVLATNLATSGSAAISVAAPAPSSAGSTMASPALDVPSQPASAASPSLLVQAMASFGASDAAADSTGAVLAAQLPQLSEIVTPIDHRASHS
jgi:hypothetical protein